MMKKKELVENSNRLISDMGEMFFTSPVKTKSSKWFMLFFLILVFIVGVIMWSRFLNDGELIFNKLDWKRAYYHHDLLKQAIDEQRVPYYVSIDNKGFNQLIGSPESMLSPQLFLLSLMSVADFLFYNILFMYFISYLGLLFIRKKFNLSPVTFCALFLLFNFNGHLTSHITVGHHQWLGCFLLPFLCLYILELVENEFTIVLSIKSSLVLFAILLQGAFHLMIWSFIFVFMMSIFKLKYLKFFLSTVLFTSLLCMFRLLPIGYILLTKSTYRVKQINGYDTLYHLFDSLTRIVQPYAHEIKGKEWEFLYGWWEYDAFIGILGVVFIVYFGIYTAFVKNNKFKDILFPIVALIVFSLNGFNNFFHIFPFNSERVTSRFIIVPLVLLIVISAVYFQKKMDNLKSLRPRLLILLGLGQVYFSLAEHAKAWSIGQWASRGGVDTRESITLIEKHTILNNTVEFLYSSSFKIGLLISSFSIFVFVVLLLRAYFMTLSTQTAPGREL